MLAHCDWYRDTVSKTWIRTSDSGVFERAYALIENDKTQLQSDFEKNYQKWDNIRNNGDFANELSTPARKCKNEAEAADFLLKWLKSRVGFMDSEFRK